MGIYFPKQDIYILGLSNCDCNSPTKVTSDIAALAIKTLGSQNSLSIYSVYLACKRKTLMKEHHYQTKVEWTGNKGSGTITIKLRKKPQYYC